MNDIVSTWATEALGGQGQATLIQVWEEKAPHPTAPEEMRAGKAAAPVRSCGASIEETEPVKFCSQAHTEEPAPVNQPQAHMFWKTPASLGAQTGRLPG